MADEKHIYTTRDKPAEHGIAITNMLLALLLVFISAFGILSMFILNDIKFELRESKIATKVVATTVTEIQVFNGSTRAKLADMDLHLRECKKLHVSWEGRLREVEHFMMGIKP